MSWRGRAGERFHGLFDRLQRLLFARDPKLWSVYRDPRMARLRDFQRHPLVEDTKFLYRGGASAVDAIAEKVMQAQMMEEKAKQQLQQQPRNQQQQQQQQRQRQRQRRLGSTAGDDDGDGSSAFPFVEGEKSVVDLLRSDEGGRSMPQQGVMGVELDDGVRTEELEAQFCNDVGDKLLLAAMGCKNHASRRAVENVVTAPNDAAINAMCLGIQANPNLVASEYSGVAFALERHVTRMLGESLAGVSGLSPSFEQDGGSDGDPAGLFVSGGTMANTYGLLMGMRKCDGVSTAAHGLSGSQSVRFLHSISGHYSNVTSLALLGVDVSQCLLHCRTHPSTNQMDPFHLAQVLENCYKVNNIVPTIMLTMGSTDTFAVDPVKDVRDIVDDVCSRYGVQQRPHIHVDAAVGWPIGMFRDYDFDGNPLEIPNHTGVLDSLQLFSRQADLSLADSFTADFHKWVACPYPSAFLYVSRRGALELCGTASETSSLFSYFQNERYHEGRETFHATIECSRPGLSVLGAYATLTAFGEDGIRIMVANSLLAAEAFRARLRDTKRVHVLNTHGPSVSWRVYPKGVSPEAEYRYEREFRSDDMEYLHRVERSSAFHKKVYTHITESENPGLFTSWIAKASHSDFDTRTSGNRLVYKEFPGEKAVFFSPLVTEVEMDEYIEALIRAVHAVDREAES